MYMNERLVPEAEVMSIKAEQITKLNLYNEQFASENYQIMNYGIGGKISGHIDSPGIIYENLQEKSMLFLDFLKHFLIHNSFLDKPNLYDRVSYGGPRLMTFMVYLSSVEAGGRTVFLQPGVSVKPEQGSALYWFNMGAQNNYDSRVFHLGCPVIYGNKWIANMTEDFITVFENANSL